MAEATAVLEPTRSGAEGRPLGGQVEQARRETRYAMDKLKDSGDIVLALVHLLGYQKPKTKSRLFC